jgi:hypothetical protein
MWPFGKKAIPEPQFGGPDYKSPERFILSFAADYKAWNDFCFQKVYFAFSTASAISSSVSGIK